ncbi:MAG TPA: lysophospholipid acyltransferase family protein [Chthoniobacteraceae bacterium]|jgi:1-acyl-sn-glycerol-3-phosphate acyltransferase|nr:lysophospholipid acyltransferase family protein [Chthoniobacteraceae bacterium]
MTAALIALLARLLTGAVPRWRGCTPQAGKRIYFANHTSNLDLVLLWASLPGDCRRATRPVAARDYWIKSRLRQWLAEKVFRAVLIERKNVTRENNPLGPMLAVLEAGEGLIIFPEGTRNPSGEMTPFKPGLFHLARQTPDAELIPVYLENLNRVLPKGEVLPVPLLCSVHFGTPMQLQPGEMKPAFLERAREAILALQRHE